MTAGFPCPLSGGWSASALTPTSNNPKKIFITFPYCDFGYVGSKSHTRARAVPRHDGKVHRPGPTVLKLHGAGLLRSRPGNAVVKTSSLVTSVSGFLLWWVPGNLPSELKCCDHLSLFRGQED